MGIIKNLKEEVRIIRERDPAIHSSMEVLLYPSFKVMIHYRLAHKLYVSGHYSGPDIFPSVVYVRRALRSIPARRSARDFSDHGTVSSW